MDSPIYAYRTSSWKELYAYRDRVGCDVWNDMEAKVYRALSRLQPGRFYDISQQVPDDQQELFVKCCCVYLMEQADDCIHPVVFKDGNIIKRY